MSSARGPKEESYQFFDNIEDYINKANKYQYDDETGQISSNCDNFSNVWATWFKDKLIAKSVCEEIIKLYKSLDNLKNKSTCSNDYKNECGFFNYMVNFKIDENRGNVYKLVSDIYNGIESQFTGNNHFNIYLDFIYDINKDDLRNMNLLYNLYDNYSKLKAIEYKNEEQDKQKLLTHSSACCTNYIKASYICDADNKSKNLKFCEKLETFVSKYGGLYNTVVQKGPPFSENFIKLEEFHNPKIITTAVTGSIVGLIPLLGLLYKFTPMGQVIRSKMGILNNDISNIDEDMTKISSMEHDNEPLRFQKGTYNIKYQSV